MWKFGVPGLRRTRLVTQGPRFRLDDYNACEVVAQGARAQEARNTTRRQPFALTRASAERNVPAATDDDCAFQLPAFARQT